MRTLLIVWLIGALWASVVGPSWAGEPAQQPTQTLQQHLDELEHVDRELAEAQQQRTTRLTFRARRQLNARIKALTASQQRLLKEIEHAVGPLPPTVEPAPPSPLEHQLELQQRHHEAIIEKDVDQRLAPN